MSLLDRLINRKCPACDGVGQEQIRDETSDGMVTVGTKYCETCHGTGRRTSDEDIDDFDLGGVGVTEDDDNE